MVLLTSAFYHYKYTFLVGRLYFAKVESVAERCATQCVQTLPRGLECLGQHTGAPCKVCMLIANVNPTF